MSTFSLYPYPSGTSAQSFRLIFHQIVNIIEAFDTLRTVPQSWIEFRGMPTWLNGVPTDRGMKPRTLWDSIRIQGSDQFWQRHFHRLGWQWNLFRQNLPLAWEITRGRPSIVIAVSDTFKDNSDHPDLDGYRWLTTDDNGDGEVTLPLGYDHGLLVTSQVIATADNDTVRGRGMIGTCPGCQAVGITRWNTSPYEIDLDSADDDVYTHVAVWNYSAVNGTADALNDLWDVLVTLRTADTILRRTMGAGIVAVVGASNTIRGQDAWSLYDSLVQGGDTVLVYGPKALTPGGHVVVDSIDPSLDLKPICVGATRDGEFQNGQCNRWDESTGCFGTPNFSSAAEIFHPDYNYSQGKEKFNDSSDALARRRAKGHAFMDVLAGGGTLAAVDGPSGSGAHLAGYDPKAEGTSFTTPQVSGIVGLMLSVSRFLGVEIQERDSFGVVTGAEDVQRRAYNLLTFTADKLPDSTVVDTTLHYITKYPCDTCCSTVVINGRCVVECTPDIDTLEIFRYLQTNPDSTPIQYAYVRQTNDPLNRSWAQRMGFGRVNAYRAVAHAIPLKGDYAYTTSATLSIADTTSINENRMRLVHFGAWRDTLVRVMDSGGVSVPGGDTVHRNMGVTKINGTGTTITVPDSLILAIDGILTTDNPTGNNSITATGNGKVLLWGYLKDVEVVGNTRIGDLTIVSSDTNTVGCVAVGQSWIDAEQYGTVTLKDHGVYLINRGSMTMYPGAEIALTGSRDLTITDGATLNMKEATRITRSGSQKVVVDSGSTLRVAVDGIAEIDALVFVKSGGRLVIDTGATLQVRQFIVERDGELVARPGSRLELTAPDPNTGYSFCGGRLHLDGTSSKRVSLTGGTLPCCDEACTTVVNSGLIFLYDDPDDLADKTECHLAIHYADVSNVLIITENVPLYPIPSSNFSASRDVLGAGVHHLLDVSLDPSLSTIPFNPSDTFPRRDCLQVLLGSFSDEDDEISPRVSADYSLVGIDVKNVQRVRLWGTDFERLRAGVRVSGCDSAVVSTCSLDVTNNGVLSTGTNLWYCNNTFHSVDVGVVTENTTLARGYLNTVDVSRNAVAPLSSGFHYLRGNTFKDFGNFGVWIRSTPVVENNRTIKKLPVVIEVLGRNVDTLTGTEMTFGTLGSVDRYLWDPMAWLSIRCGFNRYTDKTRYHLAANVPKSIQVHNNEFLDSTGHVVRTDSNVTATGSPIDTSEATTGCGVITSTEGCTITNPNHRDPWDKEIEPEYLHDGAWLEMTPGIAFFDTALAVNNAAFIDTSFDVMTRRVAMYNALAAAIFGDSTVDKLTALAGDLDVLAKDTTDQEGVRSGALIVRGLALERLGSDSAARASYMTLLADLPDAGDSIAANWSRLRLQAEAFHPVTDREEHDSALTVYYDRVLDDLRRVPEEYAPKRMIPPATPGERKAPSPTFSLRQNIPNPYRRETLIPFTLLRPMMVRLVVIDARGNEVGVVVQGDLRAGSHQATFSCRGLPAGTYFYALQTDDGSQTLPMTIGP